MTTQEFSNEFDIYYNNISSNASPGLNEYEKSVILTKAQDEVILNHFNPKGNKYQEGFDDSPKRQIDFSYLIKIAKPLEAEGIDGPNPIVKFDDRSVLFDLPKDILLIINETAKVKYDNKYTHPINIQPLTYEEYSVFNSRPYRQPYKHQGWRLINNYSNYTDKYIAEVIVKEGAELSDYTIRYIRVPNPIILIDLDSDDNGETFGDLSIRGKRKRTECELDPSLHQEILQRAVEIAKSAYLGDINTTIQLGTRTE